MSLPAPRGKKSLPTMLSRTDDFPELYKTDTDEEKWTIHYDRGELIKYLLRMTEMSLRRSAENGRNEAMGM